MGAEKNNEWKTIMLQIFCSRLLNVTTSKNAPRKCLLKEGLQLGPVGFEPTTNGL